MKPQATAISITDSVVWRSFKATPAAGWALAHLLATGEAHPTAARYRLDRFAAGRTIDEKGMGAQPNLH